MLPIALRGANQNPDYWLTWDGYGIASQRGKTPLTNPVATRVNPATYIDPDTGVLKTSYGTRTFNGSSDYTRIPNFDPTGDSGKYLSAWCWVNGASQVNSVYGEWDLSAAQRGWAINTNNTNLQVYLSDDGSYDAGHRKRYQSSVTVFDSTPHLVGMAFNNGVLKLYIDGVEDTSVTKVDDDAITTIYSSTADLAIGCRLNSDTPEDFFTGQISGAGTSPTVLTDAQWAALYAKGRDDARIESAGGRLSALVEPAGANVLLEVLSDWTNTDCTINKDATGFNGNANIGYTMTATGANATLISSVFNSSHANNCFQIAIKRKTGTGSVYITIDNGTTWVEKTITSDYTLFYVTKAATNPQLGIKLATSGDAVYLDMPQIEAGKTFPSSPISTVGIAAGAEIATGTLTANLSYHITADEGDHFYTGSVVDGYFISDGTETCDASNKVQEWGVVRQTESGYPRFDVPDGFDGEGCLVFLFTPGFDEDEVSADGGIVNCADAVEGVCYHDVSGNGLATHDGTTEITKALAFTNGTTYKVAVKWGYGSPEKFNIGAVEADSTWDAGAWATEDNFDGSYTIGSYLRFAYGPQGPTNIHWWKMYNGMVPGDAEVDSLQ